jgi:uncharacterized membrane protein
MSPLKESMKLIEKRKVKVALRGLLIVFYFVAGVNHFVHPEFYLPLIPSYFPNPDFINFSSGAVEILLAIGMVTTKYRRISVVLIILLLVAFIPSHVYFIQEGACMGEQSLCAPLWLAWVRLFPIHPLLMLWAWYVR